MCLCMLFAFTKRLTSEKSPSIIVMIIWQIFMQDVHFNCCCRQCVSFEIGKSFFAMDSVEKMTVSML